MLKKQFGHTAFYYMQKYQNAYKPIAPIAYVFSTDSNNVFCIVKD